MVVKTMFKRVVYLYRWKDLFNARPFYVGSTDDLKRRDRQHTHDPGFYCDKQDLLPSLQALMFLSMHSKCVQIEDVAPSRQIRRCAERTGGYLPVTFKVLVIRGIGSKNHKGSDGETIGNTRWHICRGHRRKYTSDAPLFGKSWGVGTFWTPKHFRGDVKNGVVDKVYEVAVP